MTAAEIAADLAVDGDLAGTIANLEACYLQPLQEADLSPAGAAALAAVRHCLSEASAALQALVEVGQG